MPAPRVRANGRRITPGVLRFDELPSASPTPELGAARRHDPYYSTIYWPYPLEVAWLPPRDAAHLFPTRPRRYIEATTYDQALDRVVNVTGHTSRHTGDVYANLLGVVHGWKTCTPEQAAALVGRMDLWSGNAMPVATSIAAGLVETGITSIAAGRPRLLRPRTRWEAHDRLLKELNLGQLLAVTGGDTWASGPDTPRHNVLATELALRIAEHCDVATLLTEDYSRLGDLAGPASTQDGWTINARAAADFTVVRTDGLRIAVELTATTSRNLARKIESYAHLFSIGAPGLTVLFVLAPSTAPEAPRTNQLRQRVMRLMERAVTRHPGSPYSPTAHRFGVISWDEWFPGPGLVSERFLSLITLRPPDVAEPRHWVPSAYLDKQQVPMDLEGDGLAVSDDGGWVRLAEMAKLRGSTPHWLRGPLHEPALRALDRQVLGNAIDLREWCS